MGGLRRRGETSQLWAVEPDAVDLSRLPEPGEPEPHFPMDPIAPRPAAHRRGVLRHKTGYLGRVAAGLLAEHARGRSRDGSLPVRPTGLGQRRVLKYWGFDHTNRSTSFPPLAVTV